MNQTIQHLATISHFLISGGQLVECRTDFLNCFCPVNASKALQTLGNRAAPSHGRLNNNLKILSWPPLCESSGATVRQTQALTARFQSVRFGYSLSTCEGDWKVTLKSNPMTDQKMYPLKCAKRDGNENNRRERNVADVSPMYKNGLRVLKFLYFT